MENIGKEHFFIYQQSGQNLSILLGIYFKTEIITRR